MDAKPAIDRERYIRSHTRAARRHATHLKKMDEAINQLIAALPTMGKPELVKLAKDLGVPRRSRLTKHQLVEAIGAIVGR